MSRSSKRSHLFDPGGTTSPRTSKTDKGRSQRKYTNDAETSSVDTRSYGASSVKSDELSDRGFVDGSIGSELKLMVPSDQNLDAYSDLSIGSDESSLYISTTIIPSEPVTTSSDSLWPSVQKLGYRHESYVNAVQRLRNTNRTLDLNTLLEYLVTESTLPSAPITSTNPVQSNKSQLQRQSAPPSSSSVSTSKVDSSQLRLIVIDGSNVAMEHGNGRVYSCKGIEIAVVWFEKRGHKDIVVFVPSHKMKNSQRDVKDREVLRKLRARGVLVKTPSRPTSEGTVASYDDRFILKLASSKNGVVVSNDHFRDLLKEEPYRQTIEKRILPFTFYSDTFMPAEDPLGKHGPTLEQLLRLDPLIAGGGVCPYGRKCTYGTKCKYRHPERDSKHDTSLPDPASSLLITQTEKDLKTAAPGEMSSSNTPLSSDTGVYTMTSDSSTTSYPLMQQQMTRLSLSQAAPERTNHVHRFNVNRPTSMPGQISTSDPQQPNTWSYPPRPLTSHAYNPVSLPSYPHQLGATNQTQFIHHNQRIPHRNQQFHSFPPHIHNPYHLAQQANQHFIPSQQGAAAATAYHSMPLDNSPSFTGEPPPTQSTPPPAPTPTPTPTPAPTAGTGTGGAREAAFNKLSQYYNPSLVFKVMDQHPEITDAKQLFDIIKSTTPVPDF